MNRLAPCARCSLIECGSGGGGAAHCGLREVGIVTEVGFHPKPFPIGHSQLSGADYDLFSAEARGKPTSIVSAVPELPRSARD